MTKNFSRKTIIKLFVDQSEVNALPAGWIASIQDIRLDFCRHINTKGPIRRIGSEIMPF